MNNNNNILIDFSQSMFKYKINNKFGMYYSNITKIQEYEFSSHTGDNIIKVNNKYFAMSYFDGSIIPNDIKNLNIFILYALLKENAPSQTYYVKIV